MAEVQSCDRLTVNTSSMNDHSTTTLTCLVLKQLFITNYIRQDVMLFVIAFPVKVQGYEKAERSIETMPIPRHYWRCQLQL